MEQEEPCSRRREGLGLRITPPPDSGVVPTLGGLGEDSAAAGDGDGEGAGVLKELVDEAEESEEGVDLVEALGMLLAVPGQPFGSLAHRPV